MDKVGSREKRYSRREFTVGGAMVGLGLQQFGLTGWLNKLITQAAVPAVIDLTPVFIPVFSMLTTAAIGEAFKKLFKPSKTVYDPGDYWTSAPKTDVFTLMEYIDKAEKPLLVAFGKTASPYTKTDVLQTPIIAAKNIQTEPYNIMFQLSGATSDSNFHLVGSTYGAKAYWLHQVAFDYLINRQNCHFQAGDHSRMPRCAICGLQLCEQVYVFPSGEKKALTFVVDSRYYNSPAVQSKHDSHVSDFVGCGNIATAKPQEKCVVTYE